MSLRVSAIFQLFKVIMPEKCALTILELNRNQRFGQDKIEHLSSYAHVVHTTAKKVISRHRKNEDVFKMSKDEKCTRKACKNTVFHCQICKSVRFLFPSWLRRTHCFFANMETTVPFGRAISVRQLPFAVLSNNVFWNRCICSLVYHTSE